MNPNRLDSLARLIGQGGDRTETRRRLLQLLGLGAGSTVLGLNGASASPGIPEPGGRNLRQSGPESLIEEIAFAFEYDTQRLITFVVEEIRYEPYAGALRGAIGTLWAGAGNSVDKAQLLAALLAASSVETRFVAGGADPSDLLAEYARTTSLPVPDALSDAVAYLANPTGATPAPDSSAAPSVEESEIEAFRAAILGDASERLKTDAGRLVDALTEAGIAIRSDEVTLPALEAESHLRLQIAFGTEWTDVNLADGSMSSIAASEAADVLEAIPDDWFHTVTMRVSHDQVNGEGLDRVAALEYTFRSQDLVAGDIALIHLNGAEMNSIGIDLGSALEGTQSYTATLIVGNEFFYATSPMVFGGQGGIFDVLGGDSDDSDGEPVGEIVEIEIRSPDAEPMIVSRTLFDRIPEQRGAESFDFSGMKPIELTDLGGNQDLYEPLSSIHSFAVVSGALPQGYSVLPPAEVSQLNAFTNAVRNIQSMRQSIANFGGTSGGNGFINRPSILRYTYGPARDDEGNPVALRIASDVIAHPSVGNNDDPDMPYGIFAGVLSQVAEESALDGRIFDFAARLGVAGKGPSELAISVGSIFRSAAEAGIPLRVLAAETDLAALPEAVVPGAQQLISAHVAAGNVVVIPSELTAGAVGWWVYDPRTGRLFDQLADGTGGLLLGPFADYALQLKNAIIARARYVALAECVAALAAIANDYLGGDKWGAVAGAIEKYGACS